MSGVEQKEDATASFPFVLRNLNGEERQIDDYEKTYWYQHLPTMIHYVFTIKLIRNNKNS